MKAGEFVHIANLPIGAWFADEECGRIPVRVVSTHLREPTHPKVCIRGRLEASSWTGPELVELIALPDTGRTHDPALVQDLALGARFVFQGVEHEVTYVEERRIGRIGTGPADKRLWWCVDTVVEVLRPFTLPDGRNAIEVVDEGRDSFTLPDGRRVSLAPETVDHPAHYGGADNPHEPIKIIEYYGLGFCTGNAIKYILRAGKKPGAQELEDLKKSLWYIAREIARLEKT